MEEYTILVVDDDRHALVGISKSLEREGYTVTSARSGGEAIKAMNSKEFDLVLTDLVMDEIDGIAVLLKAKELNPETMVVILTGYGDMETAIEALRFDADDYLLKSADSKEISIRVARCLEKLELKRQIKIYEDVLPVCCVCKKIRDDTGKSSGKGKWIPMEEYLRKKSGRRMSHSYCPGCLKESLENNRLKRTRTE